LDNVRKIQACLSKVLQGSGKTTVESVIKIGLSIVDGKLGFGAYERGDQIAVEHVGTVRISRRIVAR
jgi:hypothetical protein